MGRSAFSSSTAAVFCSHGLSAFSFDTPCIESEKTISPEAVRPSHYSRRGARPSFPDGCPPRIGARIRLDQLSERRRAAHTTEEQQQRGETAGNLGWEEPIIASSDLCFFRGQLILTAFALSPIERSSTLFSPKLACISFSR